MGYSIASTSMRSAVCRALMAKYQQEMIIQDGVEATMLLETQNAYLDQEAVPDGLSRPCLMLTGHVKELTGDFPCGISTVRYDELADQRIVTYKYMLTRSNLAELCRKGLFEPGFDTPSIIRHNEMELPCSVSCAVLAPMNEGDVPVIFTDLDIQSLECTDETSGYEIDDYFDPLPPSDMLPAADEAQYRPPDYQTSIKETFGLSDETGKDQEAEAGPKPEPDAQAAPEPVPQKQDRRRSYNEPKVPAAAPVQDDVPDFDSGLDSEYI